MAEKFTVSSAFRDDALYLSPVFGKHKNCQF